MFMNYGLSHNKRRLNPMFPSLLQIRAENLSRLRANPLRISDTVWFDKPNGDFLSDATSVQTKSKHCTNL